MSDQDFVERLRIRWETMGDMANSERAAAADEIEFLRRSQRELMGQVAALREELVSVKAERLHAVSTLSEQVDDLVRDGMADILTRTVNVLRGNPPENGLHSWHDLPELVEQLRKERDEARRMVCEKEETLGCDERGVPRNGSARDQAKQRGWDCFKENTND